MELIGSAAVFLVGLLLIVKGGDAFVDAAGWMAEVSGIPPFLVVATVVSLATTLPELLVSTMAAGHGSVDMAVGNAVGSVTANTGLILAIALVTMPGGASRKSYLGKSALLMAALLVLMGFSRGGKLSWVGCAVLGGLFALFLWENIHSAKTARAVENAPPPQMQKKALWRNLLLFVLGAAGIVAGADLMVDSATRMAGALGVPEIVVAITIVAVGTSLPELVTTITALAKGQASLSAGNVLGANIIDTTLILPACCLLAGRPLPISARVLTLDLPVSLLVNLLAVGPMLLSQKFHRWQGVVLLGIYLGYLVAVIF